MVPRKARRAQTIWYRDARRARIESRSFGVEDERMNECTRARSDRCGHRVNRSTRRSREPIDATIARTDRDACAMRTPSDMLCTPRRFSACVGRPTKSRASRIHHLRVQQMHGTHA